MNSYRYRRCCQIQMGQGWWTHAHKTRAQILSHVYLIISKVEVQIVTQKRILNVDIAS